MDSSSSVEGAVKRRAMLCRIRLQGFCTVHYFLCLWMFHSICFGNNFHDGLIQPSSFTDKETRWHGLSGVFHKINVLLSNICDILYWKKFMIYSSEGKYMSIISTLRLIYQNLSQQFYKIIYLYPLLSWKRSVFIPIPKKGNAKECSNYHTITLISHTSKVMLKILQARFQQYVNRELPSSWI